MIAPPDQQDHSSERRQRSEFSSRLQQAGLLTAIPFVLLVGPMLGYYLGNALDERWRCAPWGMGIGILLGLLSSGRVTMQLIQQARRLTSQTHE